MNRRPYRKYLNSFFKGMLVVVACLNLVACNEEKDGITSKVSFFPDGKKIIFSAIKNGIPNIYKYHLETKELTRLTNNEDPLVHFRDPSLSPDTKTIVFASLTKEASNLLLMNTDGDNIRKLTDEMAWDVLPVFPPDGKKIYFSRFKNFNPGIVVGATRSDEDIYSIRLDGSGLQKITNRSFFTINGLSISPDGKSLLFGGSNARYESGLEEHLKSYFSLVYLIDSDRAEPLEPLVVVGKKSNHDPSFSPDGEEIVFVAYTRNSRGFIYNIYLMKRDGTNVRQITTENSIDGKPVFSPDMKTIIFISDIKRNGDYRLMQVSADGTDLREIKIFGDEQSK